MKRELKVDIEKFERLYTRNIDVNNRIIYFCPWQPNEEMVADDKSWEVNDWTAQNLIKGLHFLEKRNHRYITINWLSYGGDWDAGIALFDIIKEIKSPVRIKAYGRIRSMGTVILQACKERLLAPNCLFMIHYGTAGQEAIHAKDFEMVAKEVAKENTIMEDIYLKKIKEIHPRYTREKLQDLMKYDKYMTPKEAIELGLADNIIGE